MFGRKRRKYESEYDYGVHTDSEYHQRRQRNPLLRLFDIGLFVLVILLPLIGLVPEDENVPLAAAFRQPLLQYQKKGAAAACKRIAKRIQGNFVPVKLK